ncbi:hypothetical protein SNEBB_000633 [Seison nebaliae]|nr:hypothetical protein SNEBB_000633 [Seison nebaliae]
MSISQIYQNSEDFASAINGENGLVKHLVVDQVIDAAKRDNIIIPHKTDIERKFISIQLIRHFIQTNPSKTVLIICHPHQLTKEIAIDYSSSLAFPAAFGLSPNFEEILMEKKNYEQILHSQTTYELIRDDNSMTYIDYPLIQLHYLLFWKLDDWKKILKKFPVIFLSSILFTELLGNLINLESAELYSLIILNNIENIFVDEYYESISTDVRSTKIHRCLFMGNFLLHLSTFHENFEKFIWKIQKKNFLHNNMKEVTPNNISYMDLSLLLKCLENLWKCRLMPFLLTANGMNGTDVKLDMTFVQCKSLSGRDLPDTCLYLIKNTKNELINAIEFLEKTNEWKTAELINQSTENESKEVLKELTDFCQNDHLLNEENEENDISDSINLKVAHICKCSLMEALHILNNLGVWCLLRGIRSIMSPLEKLNLLFGSRLLDDEHNLLRWTITKLSFIQSYIDNTIRYLYYSSDIIDNEFHFRKGSKISKLIANFLITSKVLNLIHELGNVKKGEQLLIFIQTRLSAQLLSDLIQYLTKDRRFSSIISFKCNFVFNQIKSIKANNKYPTVSASLPIPLNQEMMEDEKIIGTFEDNLKKFHKTTKLQLNISKKSAKKFIEKREFILQQFKKKQLNILICAGLNTNEMDYLFTDDHHLSLQHIYLMDTPQTFHQFHQIFSLYQQPSKSKTLKIFVNEISGNDLRTKCVQLTNWHTICQLLHHWNGKKINEDQYVSIPFDQINFKKENFGNYSRRFEIFQKFFDDSSNSYELLNYYCSLLPSDQFTRLSPTIKTYRSMEYQYRFLQLPINSKFHKFFIMRLPQDLVVPNDYLIQFVLFYLNEHDQLNMDEIGWNRSLPSTKYQIYLKNIRKLLTKELVEELEEKIKNKHLLTTNSDNYMLQTYFAIQPSTTNNNNDSNIFRKNVPKVFQVNDDLSMKLNEISTIMNCTKNEIFPQKFFIYQINVRSEKSILTKYQQRMESFLYNIFHATSNEDIRVITDLLSNLFRSYSRKERSSSLGIISLERIKLPFPKFAIFTRNGEEFIDLSLLNNKEFYQFNLFEIKKILYFHSYLFNNILKFGENVSNVQYDIRCSQSFSLVIPLKMNEIDWDQINSIWNNRHLSIFDIEMNRSRNELNLEQFSNSVITPTYRNREEPEYFFVSGIDPFLKISSSFPSKGKLFSSYQDYFEKKYCCQLQFHSKENLLIVETLSSRMNLLIPRYLSTTIKRGQLMKKRKKYLNDIPKVFALSHFRPSNNGRLSLLSLIMYIMSLLMKFEEEDVSSTKEIVVHIIYNKLWRYIIHSMYINHEEIIDEVTKEIDRLFSCRIESLLMERGLNENDLIELEENIPIVKCVIELLDKQLLSLTPSNNHHSQQIHFVPELVAVHPLHGEIWRSTLEFSSIFHRITSLLLARELKYELNLFIYSNESPSHNIQNKDNLYFYWDQHREDEWIGEEDYNLESLLNFYKNKSDNSLLNEENIRLNYSKNFNSNEFNSNGLDELENDEDVKSISVWSNAIWFECERKKTEEENEVSSIEGHWKNSQLNKAFVLDEMELNDLHQVYQKDQSLSGSQSTRNLSEPLNQNYQNKMTLPKQIPVELSRCNSKKSSTKPSNSVQAITKKKQFQMEDEFDKLNLIDQSNDHFDNLSYSFLIDMNEQEKILEKNWKEITVSEFGSNYHFDDDMEYTDGDDLMDEKNNELQINRMNNLQSTFKRHCRSIDAYENAKKRRVVFKMNYKLVNENLEEFRKNPNENYEIINSNEMNEIKFHEISIILHSSSDHHFNEKINLQLVYDPNRIGEEMKNFRFMESIEKYYAIGQSRLEKKSMGLSMKHLLVKDFDLKQKSFIDLNNDELNDKWYESLDDIIDGTLTTCQLLQALTLRSAGDAFDLERVELLGDSFLKFSSAIYLFLKFPRENEGVLSLLRSKLISNQTLAYLGKRRHIPNYMQSTEFHPYVNWCPPMFTEKKRKLIDDDTSTFSSNQMKTFLSNYSNTKSAVQPTSLKKEDGQKRKVRFEDEMKVNETRDMDMINEHYLSDKSIADCVEAIIGASLIELGMKKTLKVMKWFGLNFDFNEIQIEDDSQKNIYVKLNESPIELYSSTEQFIPDILSASRLFEEQLKNIHLFENRLSYRFNNKSLLIEAFTHSSASFLSSATDSYQRLELLGDAVLDFVITEHIFHDHKFRNPGEITDLRSALVNNTIFAFISCKYDFHRYLIHQNLSIIKSIDAFIERFRHKYDDDLCLDIDDLLDFSSGIVDQDENDIINSNNFDDNSMDMKKLREFEQNNEISTNLIEEKEYLEVPKCLGDIFESVAGAIFIDSGRNAELVWKIYYRMMKSQIQNFCENVPKFPVRELIESLPDCVRFSRPLMASHNKIKVFAHVNHSAFARFCGAHRSTIMFVGIGRNGRLAKTNAAKLTIKRWRQFTAYSQQKNCSNSPKDNPMKSYLNRMKNDKKN